MDLFDFYLPLYDLFVIITERTPLEPTGRRAEFNKNDLGPNNSRDLIGLS